MNCFSVQVPTAAATTGGGYVFDPATNTYYQLPVGKCWPQINHF